MQAHHSSCARATSSVASLGFITPTSGTSQNLYTKPADLLLQKVIETLPSVPLGAFHSLTVLLLKGPTLID